MKEKLKLSASRVKTFQQCKRKYYYKYEEKIPGKSWKHFDIGHLVHGTLERFHKPFKKDGSNLNLKRLMKNSFKKCRTEMERNKVLSQDVLLTSRDLLLEYLELIEEKGLGSEILGLEEGFDIELSDFVSIIGYVDRVDLDEDGIYHIKDYKTSKDPKYMEPFQLCVYGIHLLSKYENVDFFRGSYIMVRCNSQYVSYDFNKIDVEKCKKDLMECADHIKEEGRWLPSPSGLCDYCDYKDICLSTW